ncbi:MAG TPA: protein kinase [Planctomycetia bacterium]|nr:protein kinase [Planctomycetia bacterium]
MSATEAEECVNAFAAARTAGGGSGRPASATLNVHDLAKELVGRQRATMFQVSALFLQRPGRLVYADRYEILDKLASGGMGDVYRCVDRETATAVVLKLLPARSAADHELVQRFERETRLLLSLRHPNIVSALAAGREGDCQFLVMEFIDGGDLSKMVKQRGKLPLAEAFKYVIQAAEGLAFAHERGVIHRDVKPSNLVINKEGRVCILDLGLARYEDDDNPLTHTGSVLGSVDYMSPEQAFDSKIADHRCDIYSLGCTLYYLLTASHVFEARAMMDKVLAHREKPAPSLKAARPELPAKIDPVFKKMLAKDPAARHATMREAIAALADVAAEIPPTGATTAAAGVSGAANTTAHSGKSIGSWSGSSAARAAEIGSTFAAASGDTRRVSRPAYIPAEPNTPVNLGLLRNGPPPSDRARPAQPPPMTAAGEREAPSDSAPARRQWRETGGLFDRHHERMPWIGLALGALLLVILLFFNLLSS